MDNLRNKGTYKGIFWWVYFILSIYETEQDLSRKCSAWKDFGLLSWSLSLQRKGKVCGLRWGCIYELEVKSLALDKGTYKSLDS